MRSRSANFRVFAGLLLFSAYPLAFAETKAATAEGAREFSAAMKKCLQSSDLSCLEKIVHPRMYFPEQRDFGCETADTERNYATAKEFAKCVTASKTKRTGCGEKDRTLREALQDCFVDAKAKLEMNAYFESPDGSMCHFDEIDGKVLLTGVGCGC